MSEYKFSKKWLFFNTFFRFSRRKLRVRNVTPSFSKSSRSKKKKLGWRGSERVPPTDLVGDGLIAVICWYKIAIDANKDNNTKCTRLQFYWSFHHRILSDESYKKRRTTWNQGNPHSGIHFSTVRETIAPRNNAGPPSNI